MTVTAETSPKLKYPKSVFFIVSNEFCERFSFYGMRTILALYLKNYLYYPENTATVIYHIFIMLCYFFPLLGAIISDSWMGKFNTILYLSLIYALGEAVLTAAAIPHSIPSIEFTMVGLLLIAFGTGGIKPCVAAFGGDQFILPDQQHHLQKFFSVFYFAINAGSFLSTFITPLLREVKCFNEDSCYSLAFGVPAALMLTSIVIYASGKPFYRIKKPEGNVFLKVVKCITHAMTKKTDKNKKYDHWLDKAEDKYDESFIADIKGTFKVLVLFVPLPFFWSLFDQQGSRWTFQAERMNGVIGDFTLQPDQLQVLNPIFILTLTPLFQVAVYPFLSKMHLLRKPLQRMTVGGLLAAASFFVSAVIESQLEVATYATIKEGEGLLKFYNGLNQDITFEIPGLVNEKVVLKSLEFWQKREISVQHSKTYQVNFNYAPLNNTQTITVNEKAGTSYVFFSDRFTELKNDFVTPLDMEVRIKLIMSDSTPDSSTSVVLHDKKHNKEYHLNFTRDSYYARLEVHPSMFLLKVNGEQVGKEFTLQTGGVFSGIILKSGNSYSFKIASDFGTPLHMLWLLPQYFIITVAEVMFSITGLEFAYTQAPTSMKSFFQAAWLLTVAFGNLIVVVIAESRFIKQQTYEFVLFGSLMTAVMVVFAILAMKYKYRKMEKDGPPAVER